MRRQYRPAPPPLETNEQLVTALITAGWAVALITLLVLRAQLPPGQRWWIWTCLTGFAMGLFGLWYVPRFKRRRARAARKRAELAAAKPDQPRSNGSNAVSPKDTPGRPTRS